MKTSTSTTKSPRTLALATAVVLAALTNQTARCATTIANDKYTAANVNYGFALGEGLNSGINPPTTRITGTSAANLRYLKTGNKNDDAYTIGNNNIKITQGSQSGRFTLSANGTSPYNFAAALGSTTATAANPAVYDVTITMQNNGTSGRMTFAFGTMEGAAGQWSFGIQIEKSGTAYKVYKRIKTAASGLSTEVNAAISTTGTAGSNLGFLMRVTDAGTETTAYNSRVQVSLDSGSTWIYDTAADATLVNGFRFEAATRYFSWDQASNDGVDNYDNFSVVVYQMNWSGGGTDDNWNTAANWGGYVPSASAGEDFFFSASARLNPNMQADYTARTVQFSSGAGPFVVGATAGKTLTLTGDIFQNSANAQALNTPISIATTRTINTAAGNLTIGGAIGGTGGIVKSGDHTLALDGVNTYGGNTAVNAGMLLVNGSLGNGAVTVATGATLGGGGTVGGTVALSGAVAPGNSVGKLTTGNQTWNGGGKYKWEMDDANGTAGTSPGWDLLDTGGGTVEVAADGSGKFTLELVSAPGGPANFDADTTKSWQIASAATVNSFDAGDFTVTDAGFTNDLKGGTFAVESDVSGINVKFSANRAPVANNAPYTRGKGLPIRIKVADLLANRTSDADGDARQLVSVGTPGHGTATVSSGYIFYEPGSNDDDSFSYTVQDGRTYRSGDTVRQASANINITVQDDGGAAQTIAYAAGSVTVTFQGIPRFHYDVERAPTPSGTWEVLDAYANITPDSGGKITVTDSAPLNPEGYYRLKWLGN